MRRRGWSDAARAAALAKRRANSKTFNWGAAPTQTWRAVKRANRRMGATMLSNFPVGTLTGRRVAADKRNQSSFRRLMRKMRTRI